MITIDSVKKDTRVVSSLSREVKIVQFGDPPPIPLTPSWISNSKLKPEEKEWKRELSMALVKDVVTNEIFEVPESQLKWVVKGSAENKNLEATLFVKRRVVQ